jgi:hypothetical protein
MQVSIREDNSGLEGVLGVIFIIPLAALVFGWGIALYQLGELLFWDWRWHALDGCWNSYSINWYWVRHDWASLQTALVTIGIAQLVIVAVIEVMGRLGTGHFSRFPLENLWRRTRGFEERRDVLARLVWEQPLPKPQSRKVAIPIWISHAARTMAHR